MLEDGKTETYISTMHYHDAKKKYMSSTEICTLLLYKKYLKWSKHIVISKNTVSIFDLEKETLEVKPLKSFNKK